MMEDSLYEDSFSVNAIENAMTAVHLAANPCAVIGASFSGEGQIGKEREGFVQSSRVRIGRVVSEMFGAVFVYHRQIPARRGAELDFSHVGRGAGR